MQDALYHYTTASNLISMLESKKLWLTEHRFLNDRMEYEFARHCVYSSFDTLNMEEWKSRFRSRRDFVEIASSFDEGIHRFREKGHIGPALDVAIAESLYVFCLSADGDSLAQWRAYGAGQLCIQFRTSYICERLLQRGTILGRVRYVLEGKADDFIVSELRDMLEKATADTAASGRLGQLYLPEDQNLIEPKMHPMLFKHYGFNSEDEWRIVARKPTVKLEPGVNIRSIGRYLVPYLAIDFEPSEAISAIVFGPGSDPELVKNFAKVARGGYPPMSSFLGGVGIERSRLPYRG